jgi:hypothetical protein
MISGLYGSLSALLIVILSLNVIKLRQRHRVRLGDGGHDDLQAAIRAQGNAVEYIPVTLILLLLLELSGGHWALLHLSGITLVIARTMHAKAIQHNAIKQRVLSMQITIFLIIGLSILNVIYYVSSLLS